MQALGGSSRTIADGVMVEAAMREQSESEQEELVENESRSSVQMQEPEISGDEAMKMQS